MKPLQSFLIVLAVFVLFVSLDCRSIQRRVDRTKNRENAIAKAGDDDDDVDIFSQGYFEGDILNESGSLVKSAVLKARIWPDATIPYILSDEYDEDQTGMILDAMESFEDKTCLRFIPRTTEKDYINIYNARGCNSYVGKKGGKQKLSLDDGCFIPKKVKHELMHAIGFYHEQSRTDRDEHVIIHFDNIDNSEPHPHGHNFQIYDQVQLKLRTPYDIKSIMHYKWNTFALDKSKPTITARNGEKIEPSADFTETDILDINRLYNCPAVDYYSDSEETDDNDY